MCANNRIQPHSYVQHAHVSCGLKVLNWTTYLLFHDRIKRETSSCNNTKEIMDSPAAFTTVVGHHIHASVACIADLYEVDRRWQLDPDNLRWGDTS